MSVEAEDATVDKLAIAGRSSAFAARRFWGDLVHCAVLSETYTMMLAGLGLVGSAARWRRG